MQKKISSVTVIFLILGTFVAGWFGVLINDAWHEGIAFGELLTEVTARLKVPFGNYWNATSYKGIMISVLIYGLIVLLYITSKRNLMPGKEYGTARFENPKRISKLLGDEDESRNRIFSKNVRMSTNTRKTLLNNNVLVIGGSGAGKTFYMVEPNMMQLNTSFIITDPKGEIYHAMGDFLRNNGYAVKCLNLIEMNQSDCYNPFAYLREDTDVVKLITNLIANTTPKNASSNDPFWEKAEGLFLQSLFYYVWMEMKGSQRNFESVMKLIKEAEVNENKKDKSKLDKRMERLARTSPLGENHPAIIQYNKCMRGAGDTVRSIIISANARLGLLENKNILRVLSKDEMNFAELGAGVNGDGKTKTALFCIIPDSDKSYNFVVGMLYTQIFQELYRQADFVFDGRLPVHVTFLLDEFANVSLPDDFCSLLSTMRSREISSVIIIQNMAQIKALFKETWETIPGNCDTLVYLGGNEQGTHKYISELLGKATIDKRSNGETRGRQGSASRNFDVVGRELLTPDEVRKMSNKKCLVFIRGQDPVIDEKYVPFDHPKFSETGLARKNKSKKKKRKNEKVVETVQNSVRISEGFAILKKESLEYYEKLKESGSRVFIDSMPAEAILNMDEDSFVDKVLSNLGVPRKEEPEEITDENTNVAHNDNSQDEDDRIYYRTDSESNEVTETLPERILQFEFSREQIEEAALSLKAGVPLDFVLGFMYPENSAEKMAAMRAKYLLLPTNSEGENEHEAEN